MHRSSRDRVQRDRTRPNFEIVAKMIKARDEDRYSSELADDLAAGRISQRDVAAAIDAYLESASIVTIDGAIAYE